MAKKKKYKSFVVVKSKTLEQYKQKYGGHEDVLLSFTKKAVEEFDIKYNYYSIDPETHEKIFHNYLLANKKWWLIDDTYYEVPIIPVVDKFRLLPRAAQIVIAGLLGGAIVAGIAVPTTIALMPKGEKIIEKYSDIRKPVLIKAEMGDIYDVVFGLNGNNTKFSFQLSSKYYENLIGDLDLHIQDYDLVKDKDYTIEIDKENGAICYVEIFNNTLSEHRNGDIKVGVTLKVDETEVYFNYDKIHISSNDTTAFTVPYVKTDNGSITWSIEFTPGMEDIATIDAVTGEVTIKEGNEGKSFKVIGKSAKNTNEITVEIISQVKADFTFTLDSNTGYTYCVSKGSSTTSEITIPGVYNGCMVTSVGSFANDEFITKVNLPESIRGINARAFNGCKNLITMNIPKHVTYIGVDAFMGTASGGNLALNFEEGDYNWEYYFVSDPTDPSKKELKTFTPKSYSKEALGNLFRTQNNCMFPFENKGITVSTDTNLVYHITSNYTCSVAAKSTDITGDEYGIVTVPKTFTYNDNIYKVDELDYNTSSRKGAFNGCSKIKGIVLPWTINEIGVNTFANCTALESITINNEGTAKTNEYYESANGVLYSRHCKDVIAYPNAKGGEGTVLSKFVLPQSVERIEKYAFAYNTNLVEVDASNSNLKEIDDLAFAGSSISAFTFNNNLETIGAGAFANCTLFTSFKIEASYAANASLNKIDAYAFYGCTLLQNLTIPAINLKTIECGIITGCSNLQSVAFSNIGGSGTFKIDEGKGIGSSEETWTKEKIPAFEPYLGTEETKSYIEDTMKYLKAYIVIEDEKPKILGYKWTLNESIL